MRFELDCSINWSIRKSPNLIGPPAEPNKDIFTVTEGNLWIDKLNDLNEKIIIEDFFS